MNALGFFLYRFLLMPLSVSLLPFAALFNQKIRLGLRLRRERHEALKSAVRPIWIHAASGEFEYAKPVIREMKSRFPHIPIVVSYFSPSFANSVKQFPGVDLAIALPLDLPGPCRSFLNKYRPRLLLVARTDLWPEMLAQCERANTPVVIFSYTQKEFRSSLKRAFMNWMLRWVERIYCVTTSDLNNLLALELNVQVEVLGDTRYDQVQFRLSHPKPLPPALVPDHSVPCFVAGSTWTQDEDVLLPGLCDFLKRGQLRLVLVPHEPTVEHLAQLQTKLKALGLSAALYSEGINWSQHSILLVDQVGVLAELYLWAQFAFVGGSFRRSVHSVMEALGAGCLTFVGPFHHNNREAMGFKGLQLGEFHGVEVIDSDDQLRSVMERALHHPASLKEFSQKLRTEFTARLGASRHLVDKLSPMIKSTEE